MNQLRICGLSALCFLIISIAFSACRKKESSQRVSTYTFTNTLNEEVTMDVYYSKEDYYNRNNSIRTVKIPGGGNLPIEFEALHTYYLDWYTADYMHSNWTARDFQSLFATPSPSLIIAAVDDRIWISSGTTDVSRFVLLKGNELSSSWRFDVTSKPGLNGTHFFTFKRDFTGQYQYVSQSGDTTNKQIKFEISQASGIFFQMDVIDQNQNPLAVVAFNPYQYSNPPPGKDSIIVAMYTGAASIGYTAKRQ